MTAASPNPEVMRSDTGLWSCWYGRGWHLSLFERGHVIIEVDLPTKPYGNVKLSSPPEIAVARWGRVTRHAFGPAPTELQAALDACARAIDSAKADAAEASP